MDGEITATPRRRRGGRTFAVILLLLLIIALGVGGGAYILNSPPGRELTGPVSFTIEKGESLSSIAQRLEALGIIRSAMMLRAIARVEGTATRVQSGNYLFSRRMSARGMHDYLLSGNQVLERITIPEGLTMTRIADRFEDAGITSADEFLAAASDPDIIADYGLAGENAEGYLFPDTYLFADDYPAEGVVRHMIERFLEVVADIYPEYATLDPEVLHDRVVLASIVEREYRVPEEAPTIASVFYNRLEEHMRLESCATVVYVMTEEEGLPHPQRLFYRDLERKSPYNTYTVFGLPPGPIANPGRTALSAAFYPENTDYLFFVWNGPGSGRHAFSRTLSEHIEARLLYLKAP
jgi:UPF0755 protein